MEIFKKIDKLSKLSRETNGGAFVIAHEKKTGKFKVTFSSCINRSKHQLKPTDFESAIDQAISFIETERASLEIEFRYTLY